MGFSGFSVQGAPQSRNSVLPLSTQLIPTSQGHVKHVSPILVVCIPPPFSQPQPHKDRRAQTELRDHPTQSPHFIDQETQLSSGAIKTRTKVSSILKMVTGICGVVVPGTVLGTLDTLEHNIASAVKATKRVNVQGQSVIQQGKRLQEDSV